MDSQLEFVVLSQYCFQWYYYRRMWLHFLNHVWGYDYEGGTNIVDVYMNYLRNKLDGDGAQKLLHTVRGIGYVLRKNEENQ